MPTYMVWETERRGGAEKALPYGGEFPSDAITLFCDDENPACDVLVTAAEAEVVDGKWRVKPGGKSWTTQVQYEEVRSYKCCGLSEDDRED